MADVVVALDLPSARDALRLVDRLPGLRWAKIGPTLFVQSGPELIRELRARGTRVFLDLKWHDIPHQVSGAVAAAADAGVDLATVHALGGAEMMRAAAAAAGSLRLVAVTVLTSHAADDYAAAMGRAGDTNLGSEAARLARLAMGAGLHGVVTSPFEIAAVKAVVGSQGWLVVPGIRPAGTAPEDQRRTADPEAAVRAGATHLVVGRPITQSSDPSSVYQRICEVAA